MRSASKGGASSWTFSPWEVDIEEDCTIRITAVEASGETPEPGSYATFVGEPGAYYVTVGFGDSNKLYPGEDGKLVYDAFESGDMFNVYPAGELRILSVTDQNGVEFETGDGGKVAYVSTWGMDYTSPVFTVVTGSAADLKEGTFTITISDAEMADKYGVKDGSGNVTYLEENLTGEWDIMRGESYTLVNYSGKKAYQLLLNGEVIATNWTSVAITPEDADDYSIIVNAPEVAVPVSFEFVPADYAGIISTVTVNGTEVPETTWNVAGWTVNLNDVVRLSFNRTDYQNIVVKCNGEEVYNQETSSKIIYEFVAADEAGYQFEISADKNTETGIGSLSQDDTADSIYTVMGVKVSDPTNLQPGIYIVNGRKKVVR